MTRWPIAWLEDPAWVALWDRLVACHGQERARAIVAGEDPGTNADLGAWRRLGQKVEKAS